MRKVFPLVIAVALVLMAGALMAQDQKSVTLTGYLVDNNCGTSHVTDKNFATWVKTHASSCAKMDSCEKSGYSVFADNKLYKLDEKGNASAEDLLSKTKTAKGLQVKVQGTIDGETIHVTELTEVASN